jgi:hypothetical protein
MVVHVAIPQEAFERRSRLPVVNVEMQYIIDKITRSKARQGRDEEHAAAERCEQGSRGSDYGQAHERGHHKATGVPRMIMMNPVNEVLET